MRRMFIVPVLGLFALLSACAQYEGVRAATIDYAASAADRLIEDAEAVICKGPAGAIARRYWQFPTTSSAWAHLCYGKQSFIPLIPALPATEVPDGVSL